MLSKWWYKYLRHQSYSIVKSHWLSVRSFSRARSRSNSDFQKSPAEVGEEKLNYDPDLSKFKTRKSTRRIQEIQQTKAKNSVSSMFQFTASKNVLTNTLLIFGVLFTSKFLVEYLHDKSKDDPERPTDLTNWLKLNPRTLKTWKSPFMRKNRYFIQIYKSPTIVTEDLNKEIDQVNPYFYELKRMWKDETTTTGRGPLMLARLDIDQFDKEQLSHRKMFNSVISSNSK